MFPVPKTFLPIWTCFAPAFSKPTRSTFAQLITGAILAPGRRTISRILHVLRLDQSPHFTNFHRLMSRNRWSCLEVSRLLLRLIVQTFVPAGQPLVIAVDSTLERRRGRTIDFKAVYRDPVRSSRSHFVKTTAVRWLCLMVVTPVEWAQRLWALPFMSVVAPSDGFYKKRRRQPLSILERTAQSLALVYRWVGRTRSLIFVGDNDFSCLWFLHQVSRYGTFITRLRMDSSIYEPPPERLPGQRIMGRPRKKGALIGTPAQLLKSRKTKWRRVFVADFYGRGAKWLKIATGTGVWYSTARPVVPIRWLLIRDTAKKNPFEPVALLSTDQNLEALEILEHFIGRWQVEVTFELSREHLGVESGRHWSRRAVERFTPMLLGLYSVVTLLADTLVRGGEKMELGTSSWYRKSRPTFSDALALVRRHVWSFYAWGAEKDAEKVRADLIPHLLHLLCRST